ncbi:MAG: regulatory iron-sulfur-containing complex subunit RicT [Planctomycetales bacterium]
MRRTPVPPDFRFYDALQRSRMGTSYVVRYGTMRQVAEFAAKADEELPRGRQVIVRSDRGVEWGEVLCPAGDHARQHLGKTGEPGRVLREATDNDHRHREELRRREREQFRGGGELVREHKLQMQLVDVEQLFGGERLVFYYLAETRVDFRELVRALATRFRTRIEMRQIGVRDETRLLADYGDCGRPVCCNNHLREMPPVSMKAAKIQKASLDPQKISGRCGRLKCCLRYEYDTYVQFRRELPRVGATVITKVGQGRVLAQEILARKLLVEYEDRRRVFTDEKDVLTVVKGTGRGHEAVPEEDARRDPDRDDDAHCQPPVG